MEKTIHTFAKNKFQEVRVSIREFKSSDLVDIRIWTQAQVEGGMVATAKGVAINIHLLPELRKALDEVEKTLKENKMLE